MGSPDRQSRTGTLPELKTFMRGFCLTAIVLFIIAGYTAMPWLSDIKNVLSEYCEDQSTLGLMLMGICYALLLAIPFVPAVELGFLIMIIFGKTGCVFAYVCTLAGFTLSYFIGWFIYRFNDSPLQSRDKKNIRIQSVLTRLTQTRTGYFLLRCCPRVLLANRYVTIAMLINFPGNMVIGGGGGIAMFCGASGKIRFNKFFITVTIAISPVPLLMLSGIAIIS